MRLDFYCDRKSRAAYAQGFALWQQATVEITRRDHSIIPCSRHINMVFFFHAHPVRGESDILTQRHRRGCNALPNITDIAPPKLTAESAPDGDRLVVAITDTQLLLVFRVFES